MTEWRLPDGRVAAWRPNDGPQRAFLGSNVNELLYGGAAGGGKSVALVAGVLRWVDRPFFRALILRRETTDLDKLLEEAQALYRAAVVGAEPNAQRHTWRFPPFGAYVRFGHCQHEVDAWSYQSDEFQYIGFDELTEFTRTQYLQVCSRCRASHPNLPRHIRAATNPGGIGHEWVFSRWGPWLDPEYEVGFLPARRDPQSGERLPPALPGQPLAVVQHGSKEEYVPLGTHAEARTRTFVPAKLADNPVLMREDPHYAQTLRAMGPVRWRQLELGDWLIRPSAGLFFRRAWFTGHYLDLPPAHVQRRVRYWDLACSPTGDYAAGAKLSRMLADPHGEAPGTLFALESMLRKRGSPHEIREFVRATAESDGHDTEVWIEQDPGQAGKDQAASYAQLLAGFRFHARPKRVDKVTAAGPVSSQAEAGNLLLVRGPWLETFFAEAEAFPEGDNDDQVDALSGAFTVVVESAAPTRLPRPPPGLFRTGGF